MQENLINVSSYFLRQKNAERYKIQHVYQAHLRPFLVMLFNIFFTIFYQKWFFMVFIQ